MASAGNLAEVVGKATAAIVRLGKVVLEIDSRVRVNAWYLPRAAIIG